MKNQKQAAKAILFVILSAIFFLAVYRDAKPLPTVTKEERDAYIKKYPFPKNSIRLKRVASFPGEELMDRDIYLRSVMSICFDPANGDIYAADMDDHKIMVFDSDGNYLRKFGSYGQGPGSFIRPYQVQVWNNRVVVNDVGNLRFQILDKSGKYTGGFRVFRNYRNMIISKTGIIYAAPIIFAKGYNYLVDTFSMEGKKLFSFGEKIETKAIFDFSVINDIRMGFDQKGNFYYTFTLLPVLRKYSEKGEFISETDFTDYPFFKDKMESNKECFKATKLDRSKVFMCISALRMDDDRVFVARFYMGRLEIVEFDDAMKVKNIYWTLEYDKGLIFFDFLVKKEKEKYVFYLPHVIPEVGIDIFKY